MSTKIDPIDIYFLGVFLLAAAAFSMIPLIEPGERLKIESRPKPPYKTYLV